MSRLALCGGRVVTAEATFRADVLIEHGRISAVGLGLAAEGVPRLDATGKLVMPGFIDAHTHLDGPQGTIRTCDDWDTGTAAALAGGTTTVIDMAVQEVGRPASETVAAWIERATGKARCDFGLHVVLTDVASDVAGALRPLPDLGVASVKAFLAYTATPLYMDDALLLRVLQEAGALGLLTLVHAENGPAIDALVAQARVAGNRAPRWHALTRPPGLEAEATARALRLARIAGAPVLVVHVSCAEALTEVDRGRELGARALAETCPQYVAFTMDELAREGFEGAKYVCSPPLRAEGDQLELWRAMADGRVQIMSSDHCPFHFKGQKDLGANDFALIPNGIAGIEERASVLWSLGVRRGRISATRFVELLSTEQARIHGLLPRKGILAPGADADIVIWDPGAEQIVTHRNRHGATDHTPYEGLKVRGAVSAVLLRGEVVFRDGVVLGAAGRGEYLHRGG